MSTETRADKRDTHDASEGEQTACTTKIPRVSKRHRKFAISQSAGDNGSNQGIWTVLDVGADVLCGEIVDWMCGWY